MSYSKSWERLILQHAHVNNHSSQQIMKRLVKVSL